MAMFLCGLEDTPYSGWTLSGMAKCGPRLFLSGGGLAVECNDKTGWTAVGGSGATAKYGKLVYTTNTYDRYDFTPGATNYFDIRVDFDSQLGAGLQQYSIRFGATNYVYCLAYPGNNTQGKITAGGTWFPNSGVQPSANYWSWRVSNLNDSFVVYFMDPSTMTWTAVNAATGALGYGAATGVLVGSQGGPCVAIYDNVRNVMPTVTSGTATSLSLDTVDGFRGVGWYDDAGQTGITGTVTVEYQTSADNSNWTGWTTAGRWAPVTPSASNRYVKIRVTISGGSTTSASPEVGPIVVNGSLDSTSAGYLFKRHTANILLHANSNYAFSYTATAASTTAYMHRAALGIGRWLGVNGNTFSYQGTTTDLNSNALAQALVAGCDYACTQKGGSNQWLAEAASYLFPGLWEARAVLFPSSSQLATTLQKQNWTKKTNDWISSYVATNWRAFAAVCRQSMKALRSADTLATTDCWTQSTTASSSASIWADSDSNAEISGIAATLVGEGCYVDDGGHAGDTYTADVYIRLLEAIRINPSFDSGGGYNAALISGWGQNYSRVARQTVDGAGNVARWGRSLQAHAIWSPATCAYLAAEASNAGWGVARELASRAVWNYLRTQWLPGFDFGLPSPNKLAQVNAGSSQASLESECPTTVSYFGLFAAANASFYSATPTSYSYNTAAAHPAWGLAIASGPDGTYPQIASSARTYDDMTQSTSTVSMYQCSRMTVEGFGANTGQISTYEPCPSAGGMYWADSSRNAGSNLTYLADTSARGAYVLGKAGSTYRTGTPRWYSSASYHQSNSGATQTEIYWLRGRHVVCLGKIYTGASDTRTASNFGFASCPIPIPSGGALANTATTSTTAYAESPSIPPGQRDVILSVFGQGLTANMQGAAVRTGTAFLTSANQLNRDWYGGLGIDFTKAGATRADDAGGGPIRVACDFAYSFGSMTAATEAAMIGSWNLTGDVATFTYDPNGTPENVYLAFTGQSNPTVGSYAITGTVQAFTGKTSAADWWGVDNATLVQFGGVNQARLQSAGNLAIQKLSNSTTRVWTSGSDTTLYPGSMPGAPWTVWANAWDGSQIDVTASCTISAGVSVVIPSSLVSTYSYGGLAVFDVGGTPGSPIFFYMRRLSGGFTEMG